jgi:HD-GYP domain-containing protein (c-di-GMP phosphodiesterase class II)
MKKIPVDSLKPGLIFSKPVFMEGGDLFVSEGVPLKQKEIDRLKTWGFTTVETDGESVTPGQEQAHADDRSKAETVQPAEPLPKGLPIKVADETDPNYHTYKDHIMRLGHLFSGIVTFSPLEVHDIDFIVEGLMQSVRDNPQGAIGLILGAPPEKGDDEMAKAAIDTAILSDFTALELKMPRHRILQTIQAALLHDTGMLRLPAEIVNSKGALSLEQTERMRNHPSMSFRIITRELNYPVEVGTIAMQHHERWDGTGYPRRLPGKLISLGAQIVSVADAFEAMISEKPYRNSMMGYEAMKNLMSDNGRRFNPQVLKCFVKIMGIYPINSFVLLNNKSIARVTEVSSQAPLRPKLQIMSDGKGHIYGRDEGDSINLLNEKKLYIVRPVNPKEIV